jgi:hypothetical protein
MQPMPHKTCNKHAHTRRQTTTIAHFFQHTLVDVKEDAWHVAARERDRVLDAGEIDERQTPISGAFRRLLDKLATELRQNVAILAVLSDNEAGVAGRETGR